MSNETSSLNHPPKNTRRFRSFCLSTYLSKAFVSDILLKHDKQIRAYAFIEHNKDIDDDGQLKECHIHILIRTINARTVQDVVNWFKGFYDVNGLPINTFGQEMHDISSSFDYLTHSTEQAKEDGKHQYDKSEIVSNNIEYFENCNVNDEDNISLALTELCKGVLLKDVALKYGRDFIIHYQSIKMCFNDIQLQLGGKTI